MEAIIFYAIIWYLTQGKHPVFIFLGGEIHYVRCVYWYTMCIQRSTILKSIQEVNKFTSPSTAHVGSERLQSLHERSKAVYLN